MCPACFTNIALITVGAATSTGGLTAFVMKAFKRKETGRNKTTKTQKTKT